MLYDDKIYPNSTTTSSLRGILFGPQDSSHSILNVVIANNTIIGMPTNGMSLSFKDFSSENVDNMIIANNIISNCYTNDILGPAINITRVSSEDMIGLSDSGAKVIFDNNIVYEGENGDSAMGYNGNFFNSYKEFVSSYNLNINGAHIDPQLNPLYKPSSETSPVVDNGYDLSQYFNYDLEGTPRPQNIAWDIGAYEFR